MPTSRPFSRRTALAGLGAGSLGLFMAAQSGASTAVPNRETGGSGDSTKEPGALVTQTSLAGHPLAGLWLATMAMPSHPDDVVAVPTFFGADGSAVLIFPCTEANDTGVMLKGAAVGTWTAIDDRYAHFTTVHAVSDMDGRYHGTVTFDGYPLVSDDGETFADQSDYDLFTVRDHLNRIVKSTQGPFSNPMLAYRMHAGRAGFPLAMEASDAEASLPVAPDKPRPDEPQ